MRLGTRSPHLRSGLTWLEVHAILFLFVMIFCMLFLWGMLWKRGADRSANILHIRNVQNAVRGHSGMYNLNIGDALPCSAIVSPDGSTGYLKTPRPPAGLPPYTYDTKVPCLGALYVTNHFNDPVYGFSSPFDYDDW